MKIEEEVAVTTTANAGSGLDLPQLPIAKQNVFRRIKDLSDKKKKSPSKDGKD